MKSLLPRLLSFGLVFMFSGALVVAAEAKEDAVVEVAAAEEMIAEGIQLLDIRTQPEWDEGHLEGAEHVDFHSDDFVAEAKAALDLTKPLLLYCRSGNRTVPAADLLREAGFETVYEMAGGILAWRAADKPVLVPGESGVRAGNE